jgi:hypothetical protein
MSFDALCSTGIRRAGGVLRQLFDERPYRGALCVPRSAVDELDDALHLGGQLSLIGKRRTDLLLNVLIGVPNVGDDVARAEAEHRG